jgi:hypothetical protein
MSSVRLRRNRTPKRLSDKRATVNLNVNIIPETPPAGRIFDNTFDFTFE